MKIGTSMQDGKIVHFAWTSTGVFFSDVGHEGIRLVISKVVFEEVRSWIYKQFLEMEKIVKEGFSVSQYVRVDDISQLECS